MHIQELETRTGLDRATIRYYEKEGLICPNRLQNGYRDYSKKDLEDLLRIKLLRMLDVPLDQIIMIRKGKVTVGAALTHRFNMLNDERQHLDQIEAVCNELIRSTCVFDELDPVPYLAMFSEELPHKITEFSLNTAEQVVLEQPHPFRRYFARWFDLNLYSVILAVIWYFILNIRPFLDWHDTVLGIVTVFLSIPVNAVLLAKFGTTCGKRLMGISLEAVDDAEITFRDALRREWNVFRYGYGFNIPIYSLWRLYKNYKACKAGEWHDWEEYGSEIKYHCYTKNYRRIFLLFTGIIVIITIIIAFFANYPPNYGTPMAIGELAENYNAVAAKYGSISRMDQTGQIYEDETSMFSLCQPQYVMYTCDKEWVCGDLKRFNDDIIAFNEVKCILDGSCNEVDIVEESKETNKYFLYYELVYRSNEVIGKDCTIIEAENLNDELLHKKKLEIESKFQYSTDEKRRNAHVVFVNIVKL